MDLDSIKNRKIRSQLRYLQLELEETKIIYEECLLKFNNDISSPKRSLIYTFNLRKLYILQNLRCLIVHQGIP